MTTTITEGEIRLIYVEIVMVAIIGVFVALWSLSPIVAPPSPTGPAPMTSGEVHAEDSSWISNLMDDVAGLPIGAKEIFIVSSIVLIPLTIMNSFVVIRIVKDLATGWL